ncbi:MAG TPA: chemotaxis-specific protein-glutamate methyltransferase CheB [Desulfobacterales bacterium]|nr:chemotaxis-specific protein-glutamate methyltransferase CheB [Desulfobacterales bacterium]
MIKVLIVDDSPTIQEYLRHIISMDEELEVAGMARDGDEAVRLVQKTHPDVVTMDIQMPRMDGYEATRKIMEVHPVPIVVISSTLDPEQVSDTFRAIRAGAVAALEKPKGPGHPESDRMAAKIVQTVKLMSEVRVVKRFSPANRRTDRKSGASRDIPSKCVSVCPDKSGKVRDIRPREVKVVAIGASTGGPPVIRTILSNLPENFPVPILLVQHIAPGFLQGMVEWLDKESALSLQISNHGERIRAGHAYFAPDGYHTGISRTGEILLSRNSPVNGLRPSVSHLFQSVAEAFGRRAAGVLLTGMGKDGAPELKLMREAGAVTIAQNKESSVVHGMPGEAIKLEAAKHILSPEEIADFLCQLERIRGKG